MSEVADVRSYSFRPENRLFLDANVWFLIHGPAAHYSNRIRDYTRAYKALLEAKSRVFVEAMVLSEFVNTYAKWEFRQYSPQGDDYKDFRNRESFRDIAKDIAGKLRRIMKICCPCDLTFTKIDLTPLIDQFGDGGIDFNDQIITQVCRSHEFTLITDDGDFAGSGLRILTANPKLLPGTP